MPGFKYDVCLSFAGEDREYVEAVASYLRAAGVAVFYDRYHESDLWGKNLYEHLSRVYRDEARYCVMFISQYYAAKLWTSHERRSAQERAFRESEEYILPVRFDDTEVPGLATTTGYLNIRSRSAEDLASLIVTKLKLSQVPTTPVPEVSFDVAVMADLLSEERLQILRAYDLLPTERKSVHLDELRRRMHGGMPGDAVAAMTALFHLGDRQLAAHLMQLVHSALPSIRRRAIFYLGELKSRQALPLITSAMSDSNINVRATARQALVKISGRKRSESS
jgi:hypothetical protein